MTGMLQGRAQLQTITIGGSRDGDVLAYRLDVLADAGAYPRIGAFLPCFTRLMAPGRLRHPEGRVAGPGAGHHHHARPGPTAAPAAPRRPRRSSGPWTCSRPRSAWTRPRCAGATSSPPDKFPFTTKGGATYDTGEYAKAIDRVLEAAGYAELRAEQAARRERGDAVQLGIGVSAYVEITGGGAFAEDATVEVHPDGTVTVLTGTSPHGQGHATAWAMLASEHLGIPIEKITVKHGDTDLIPRGVGTMGSRSLQTGGVAVLPGRRRAGRAGQAARRRPAGGRASTTSRSPTARCGCAAPAPASTLGRAGRDASSCGSTADVRQRRPDVPVRRARRRRRGRRRVRQGGRRPDRHRRRRRARCSTRCSPRASATAASPRASRRRCSRRSSTTTTATR